MANMARRRSWGSRGRAAGGPARTATATTTFAKGGHLLMTTTSDGSTIARLNQKSQFEA